MPEKVRINRFQWTNDDVVIEQRDAGSVEKQGENPPKKEQKPSNG